MKQELIWAAILLWLFVLVGWLAPALISMDDTFAVLLGIALLLVTFYLLYRYIRRFITTRSQKVPKQ